MPWRLIVLIVILAVFLSFIGFNLSNTSNLSFGFTEFADVPVYLTVFVSFVLGMISSLPFIIFGSLKRKHKKDKAAKASSARELSPENAGSGSGSYGID